MKNWISIVSLLIFFGLCGCGSSFKQKSDLSFSTGDYYFNMLDSNGNKIASGKFSITSISDNTATGLYKFENKYINDFSAFEVMSGEFNGQLDTEKKTLWMNTNPKISDNKVFINITAGKFSYIGEWRYSTMRGIQNWGKIQFFESK